VADELPGLRLVRELGRGTSAVVHEAVTVPAGERVAVKIVTGGDPARVLREARAAAAVDHPGIVPVREVGSSGDRVWLVLDLVEGEDLQHRLDRDGPLPVAAAAGLAGRVARAAAALHAAGVTHRDISPANVLLSTDGRVLLTDFGSASPPPAGVPALTAGSEWATSGGDTTLTGGTWAYMAPEQWRGDPTDPRTDVYALGGLLYAALTGQRPYRSERLAELVHAAVLSPPPRPSALVEDLPPGLDAVVARAMAKDPAERYPTAAAFAADVRAALTAPGPEPARRRPPGAARRHVMRVVAAVLAGALALGAVGTTIAVVRRDSPDVRLVCAQDLTVRDRPGGVVLGTLYAGDRFVVERTEGAWAYGRAARGSGWVLTEWLGSGRC
jgi:serine/threonine protein kinase